MNNIKINAVNIELTEDIKNYINKKTRSLEKFIDFNDDSVSMDIRISKMVGQQQSGKIYKTEMSIMTAKKKFGASGEGNSINEAIDSVKDAVVKKISVYKDKKHSLFKKGGTKIKSFLKNFNK